jgi:hypothetical protein
MFLRHKLRRKDGKQHRYWSIVENRRVCGGRAVQRHVLYLGEINDSQRAAWCQTIEAFDEGGHPSRRVALFPEDRAAPRWTAMWCMSGSAACASAGPGNGVAVGWRATCGISLSWMISGHRVCRRHGREHIG